MSTFSFGTKPKQSVSKIGRGTSRPPQPPVGTASTKLQLTRLFWGACIQNRIPPNRASWSYRLSNTVSTSLSLWWLRIRENLKTTSQPRTWTKTLRVFIKPRLARSSFSQQRTTFSWLTSRKRTTQDLPKILKLMWADFVWEHGGSSSWATLIKQTRK